MKERARFLYEHKVKTFRRAAERGVRWAVGSDTSMFLPVKDYYRELEAISQALDIAPSKVILGASKGNASLLGLDRVGEVAPGYLADLIVVGHGDPTRDLSTLKDVRYTITAGRLIDWSSFESALGTNWPDADNGGV